MKRSRRERRTSVYNLEGSDAAALIDMHGLPTIRGFEDKPATHRR